MINYGHPLATMVSYRYDEERRNLEKFCFPKSSNTQQSSPACLGRCCAERSVPNNRKLHRNQPINDGSLFQELSQCKMISTPNHCHRRHHFKGLHKSISLSDEQASEAGRLSPIRQWRWENYNDNNYVYHSSRKTKQHLNEQMEMNSKGCYESLTEFARDNKLDVRGKVFAICEEPKIDLDEGLEE